MECEVHGERKENSVETTTTSTYFKEQPKTLTILALLKWCLVIEITILIVDVGAVDVGRDAKCAVLLLLWIPSQMIC